MQFRFEDILKNMIPGSVIIFSLIFYFFTPLTPIAIQSFLKNYIQDYSAVIVVIFFIISYIGGYIIDALASWGEYYTIYKVAGTPAYKLFKQLGNRMTFQNSDLVLYNLNKEYKIYERKIIKADLKTLNLPIFTLRDALMMLQNKNSKNIIMLIFLAGTSSVRYSFLQLYI